jgi:hypothetical protein
MEARVDEEGGISDFADCVYLAHRDAVLECGPSAPPSVCSLAALNETTRVELDQAPDNHSRVRILRQASISKKAVLKAKITEKFVRNALTAPREDKSRSRARVHALRINGEDTFDTTKWEAEFRREYTKLFGDESNGPEVQQERLRSLREKARGEQRIVVPDFMLREILSKGARKAKSAPSRDGVGWGAVGSLPRKAFLILKSLLEARLNSDEDTDELISDWICIFILLIPKVKSPTTLNTWRPIAICSVLQKVFLKLVVTLMQELSDPLEVEQYGFRPGRQTLEPVDIVRTLLAKGSSWGLPFSFAKGDLFRAFDNIKHGPLQRSLEHRKVPSRLQLAIFRELSGSTVTLDFQGQEYADIPFHKGGRQGGSETPDLWNSVVNLGLFNAKQRWKSERLGIRLKLSESSSCFDGLTLTESESFRAASFVEGDEYVVYGVFWADDAIIFGMDEVMCCRAWEILTEELRALGLDWKPGSLELLVAGFTPPADGRAGVWAAAGSQYLVPSVERFVFLGAQLNSQGCPIVMARFRCSQAWIHFWSRQKQFCCRVVPLRLRWQRLLNTVMRTAFYLAGAFAWNTAAANMLHTMFFKMLGFTLVRLRLGDEDWGDFHHRIRGKLADLVHLFALPSVSSLLARFSTGWIGHVVRSSQSCPVAFLHSWRDASWWAAVKNLHPRPTYRLRGAQARQPTDILYECLGPFWQVLAESRDLWRRAAASIVQLTAQEYESVVPSASQTHASLRPFFFAPTLSNKLADFVGGKVPHGTSRRLGVLMVSDCLPMVLKAVGRSNLRLEDQSLPAFLGLKRLRWLLYLLEYRLPFEALLRDQGLLVQRPRGMNTLADAVCNLVMNERRNFCWVDPGFQRVPPGFLHVYSDGGFRSSSLSSCACVLEFHSEDPPMCAVVGVMGRLLSVQNSYEAEIEGMISSCEFLVDVIKNTSLWTIV